MRNIPRISLNNFVKKINNGDIKYGTKILLPKKRIWDYFLLFSVFNIYSYNKPLTAEDGIYYRVYKEDFYWGNLYRHNKYIGAEILYEVGGETLIRPYQCLNVKDFNKTDFEYIVRLNKQDEIMYDDLINSIYKFGFNNIRRIILDNSKSYSSLIMFHYILFKKILEEDIERDSMFLLFNYIKNMRFNYLKEYVPEVFNSEKIIEDHKKYNDTIQQMNNKDRYLFSDVLKYIEVK